MRIGIDARFYGGEQSKGLGRYVQKLIEYLAENEDDHQYVIFLQQEGFDNWNIDNPRFTPVLAPYHWYTVTEQLLLPLKIWQQNIDLMHFPHFNVPLLFRGKFLVTIHDLIILHFPTERATTLGPFLYKLKHWAGQMVMRHAALHSTHIITVSEFSKKDIVEYYSLPESRVSVTYEAAEIHNHLCTDEQVAEVIQGYVIKQPYLLYVGNVYPHKNVDVLLEVAKKLVERGIHTYRFVIVGKKDYFIRRLEQEVWAKDIEKLFVFTGFVSDEDLPCLYKGAHAFIFPSLYEGFGLPPLEAMAYGTPVLSSDASCMPEILGDAAHYFEPSDVNAIMDGIIALEDPTEREAYIEKGLKQVGQYSWRNMMEETIALYEQQKKENK